MTGIETALATKVVGDLTLGTALTIASTGMTALGAIQQGNAAKAAAQQNAMIMERNAVIARQQGAAAAAKQEREARIRAGAARAQVGGSGVLLESFGDLLEDSARQEEMDRLTILYNAELQAQSGELSAAGERRAGASAQKAGYMGAAGALLKGAASATPTKASTGPKASLGGSNTWDYSPRYTGATADAWTK